MSEGIRKTMDDAIATGRAYRFLTFALFTKLARLLMGLQQYRMASARTGETATFDQILGGGFVSMVASADLPIWIMAEIFFGLWLWRVSAAGFVTAARNALPRSIGLLFALALVASVLSDLYLCVGPIGEVMPVLSAVLPQGRAAQGLVPVLPKELPIVYFKLAAVRLAVCSGCQLLVVIVLRHLMQRVAEEDLPAPTPPAASDPAPTPPEPPASPAADAPAAGFGWPGRPTRDGSGR